MFNPKQLQVYFICGTQDIPDGRTIEQVLEEALQAGITLYQFREKGPTALKGEDKKQLALKLKSLCQTYQVPFIVNDDVALAKEIDADGIHVGQDDEAVKAFAAEFENKIIGLSIGNLDEYQHSDLSQVNYIGVGPMYATPSKDDASEPVGPSMIKKLREYLDDFPIVAIGGINESNVASIAEADADGISVISAISRSDNIDKTVKHFLSYFK
ncbi:thiamine phosphate synthase [Staphylococcus caprae]|uniref:thiamine phosphate synthase n=1 Tax=Staphylococcus caprae TaxID=29380 RepID=UPI001F5610A7|nr:thiamine phosphate synthase [Staphylococcus caprae]MCI2955413.1 thiamine phosphate synthase [Staphylococcus caprae]